MARILILGPSAWRDTFAEAPREDPLEFRARLGDRMNSHGHDAVLLENLPGPEKPLRRKFMAALRDVDDIVVY